MKDHAIPMEKVQGHGAYPKY